MYQSMVFGYGTRERDNFLLLNPLDGKVPTNQCVVPRNRFLINMIACIAGVKVGLHAKMTMS